MNASKLLISSVAALSVVGALGLANAQQGSQPSTTPGTSTMPATPNQQLNNTPADTGTTTTTPAPGGAMNNNTMGNAPMATDPTLPPQADRN